jgi:hypothetical protein
VRAREGRDGAASDQRTGATMPTELTARRIAATEPQLSSSVPQNTIAALMTARTTISFEPYTAPRR